MDDGKGTSVAITHNAKGEHVVQLATLQCMQTTVQEAVAAQGNIRRPSKKPEQYQDFWDDYAREGFDSVAKKYIGYGLTGWLKKQVKELIWRTKYGTGQTGQVDRKSK